MLQRRSWRVSMRRGTKIIFFTHAAALLPAVTSHSLIYGLVCKCMWGFMLLHARRPRIRCRKAWKGITNSKRGPCMTSCRGGRYARMKSGCWGLGRRSSFRVLVLRRRGQVACVRRWFICDCPWDREDGRSLGCLGAGVFEPLEHVFNVSVLPYSPAWHEGPRVRENGWRSFCTFAFRDLNEVGARCQNLRAKDMFTLIFRKVGRFHVIPACKSGNFKHGPSS